MKKENSENFIWNYSKSISKDGLFRKYSFLATLRFLLRVGDTFRVGCDWNLMTLKRGIPTSRGPKMSDSWAFYLNFSDSSNICINWGITFSKIHTQGQFQGTHSTRVLTLNRNRWVLRYSFPYSLQARGEYNYIPRCVKFLQFWRLQSTLHMSGKKTEATPVNIDCLIFAFNTKSKLLAHYFGWKQNKQISLYNINHWY